jgi:hypothetical protein
MIYKLLIDDRKALVKRMEALTGEKPRYTFVPRCAYLLHGLAVEKDDTVTTEEDADMDLVNKLITEGWILPGETEADGTEPETEEEPVEEPEVIEQADAEETVEAEDEEDSSDPSESPEAGDTTQAVKPRISFPLKKHRPESICNLVFTIYSRGKLLSKVTGGDFAASESLVETLKTSGSLRTVEEAIRTIQIVGPEALRGICFEEEKIVFDGFPETNDPLAVKAWTALSTAINRNAIKQIHVQAKEVDCSNEKFTFRTWLTRLGMNGPELKEERNLMYRNLSGHTAFRTKADEEKWKARQAAKRQELREQKMNVHAEGPTTGAED